MRYFLFALIFCLTMTRPLLSHANNKCQLHFVKTARESLNERIYEKYPEFKVFIEKPDEFVALIQKRFKEQKEKDPQNALQFNYTEIARPAFEFATEKLAVKILSIQKDTIQAQEALTKAKSFQILKKKILQNQIIEYKIALEFYQALAHEAKSALAQPELTYQKSIEFLYYFSRAYGHFDSREQSLMTRFYLQIDRALQGYKQLKIATEFDRYKKRKFEISKKIFSCGI